jgi:arylsulfatase A-like enzyme
MRAGAAFERSGATGLRGALGALALLLVNCGGEPPEAHRNLLLITVDTLRADHLEAYGYDKPTSPRLQELARSAVVFDEMQAHSSWTLASLASIVTSRYPSSHGCRNYESQLPRTFDTLAEVLFSAGFDTAMIASHVFLGHPHGLHQGFVHLDDDLVSRDYEAMNEITSSEVSDKAIAWVRHKGKRRDPYPWFLWVHYFDPHSEYQAHADFPGFGDGDVGRYDGEIAYTDHHIGRLLDALAAHGLANDTVVALVADHGEEFDDHGGTDHGRTLYREVLRVPLVIRAPGIAPRRVGDDVGAVDILPTLLELLGVARRPERIEGRSLVPAMRGEALEPRPILAELRLYPDAWSDAIIAEGHKLVLDRTARQTRLYDLASDPREMTDVAAERPDVVARLERELEQMIAAASEGARTESTGEANIDALAALGYVVGEGEVDAAEGFSGRDLQQLRRDARYTLADMASVLGLTVALLEDIERGEVPVSRELLQRIVDLQAAGGAPVQAPGAQPVSGGSSR